MDKLEEQGGKFAQVYEANELPLEDTEVRLVEPAEVSRANPAGREEVELQGKLQTKLEAVCGRCLQPVELRYTEFNERFVRAVKLGRRGAARVAGRRFEHCGL